MLKSGDRFSSKVNSSIRNQTLLQRLLKKLIIVNKKQIIDKTLVWLTTRHLL